MTEGAGAAEAMVEPTTAVERVAMLGAHSYDCPHYGVCPCGRDTSAEAATAALIERYDRAATLIRTLQTSLAEAEAREREAVALERKRCAKVAEDILRDRAAAAIHNGVRQPPSSEDRACLIFTSGVLDDLGHSLAAAIRRPTSTVRDGEA